MQMNKFGLESLPQECQPTDYGHNCLLYWSIYKSNVKNQHDNYPVLLRILNSPQYQDQSLSIFSFALYYMLQTKIEAISRILER